MIWPRWAAACSSFSINNCVHKNERTGDNKRRRGRSSSRSRQQQRWQRQRSVQAENQLRDSLICMSTPKSSPLVTPPQSHPLPSSPRLLLHPDNHHLTPNFTASMALASKSQSPCGYVCDSVETDRHSGAIA